MRPLLLPTCMDELWEDLSRYPEAALYFGGTDFLVKLRKGLLDPPCLLCLEKIPDLKGIDDHGDRVFIHSGTTYSALLRDPIVSRDFTVLASAVRRLGSPPIRNMGTLGGNIMTASPAGDSLPPLYVLGAHVQIQSRNTSRKMPIKEFIRGPGETDLHPGEILAGVWVNKPPVGTIHHYEKIGQRKALAIAVASLAGLLQLSRTGVIQDIRLAWGSVGPCIVVSKEVESAVIGLPLTRQTLERAVPLVQQAVRPIDDLRASARYRRMAAGNLLFRFLDYSERIRTSPVESASSGVPE